MISLLAYISSCFMPCNMTESGIPSLDWCTGEDSEDWFHLWRGHRARFLTSPHDWGFPSEASKSMTYGLESSHTTVLHKEPAAVS